MYKLQVFTAYKKIATPDQMTSFNEVYNNLRREDPQAIVDRIISDNSIDDKDRADIDKLMQSLDENGDGAIDKMHMDFFMKLQKNMMRTLKGGYTLENGENSYPTLKAIMTNILRRRMPNYFPKGLFSWGEIKFVLAPDRGLEVYKNNTQVGYINTVQWIFEPNRIK